MSLKHQAESLRSARGFVPYLVRSRAANPIADPSAGVPGVAEDASLEDVEGGQVDAGPYCERR